MCIVLIKRGSSCSRTTATTTAASASTKKKRDKKIHFNYVLIVFRVLCSFCVRFVSPINQFYPLIPTIRPSFIIKIKRHTHTHRSTRILPLHSTRTLKTRKNSLGPRTSQQNSKNNDNNKSNWQIKSL